MAHFITAPLIVNSFDGAFLVDPKRQAPKRGRLQLTNFRIRTTSRIATLALPIVPWPAQGLSHDRPIAFELRDLFTCFLEKSGWLIAS